MYLTIGVRKIIDRIEAVTPDQRPRIIVQVINAKNKGAILSVGAQEVICVKEVQSKVLSQGTLCYGLCALIGNLYRSLDLDLTDYADGCDFEIYKVGFSKAFEGHSYVTCAHFLYTLSAPCFAQAVTGHSMGKDESQALRLLLIGIMRNGEVLLNPNNDEGKIREGDEAILLAEDLEACTVVKMYDGGAAPSIESSRELVEAAVQAYHDAESSSGGGHSSPAHGDHHPHHPHHKDLMVLTQTEHCHSQFKSHRYQQTRSDDTAARDVAGWGCPSPGGGAPAPGTDAGAGAGAASLLGGAAAATGAAAASSPVAGKPADQQTAEAAEAAEAAGGVAAVGVKLGDALDCAESKEVRAPTPSPDRGGSDGADWRSGGLLSGGVTRIPDPTTPERKRFSMRVDKRLAAIRHQEHEKELSRGFETVSGSFVAHVILCGTTNVDHVVRRLLEKDVFRRTRRATITVLHRDDPPRSLLALMEREERQGDLHAGGRRTGDSRVLSWIRGDPQVAGDLVRAGIERATSVILLASLSPEGDVASSSTLWQGDGELIKTVLVIRNQLEQQSKERLRECIVLAELGDSENTCFIDPTRWWPEEGRRFSLSPIYASGAVFPNTLLETAVVQAYYTPALLKVLDKLLEGPSALRHVRVPRDFDGKCYGDLFLHLLLYHHTFCIAIYTRGNGRRDKSNPAWAMVNERVRVTNRHTVHNATLPHMSRQSLRKLDRRLGKAKGKPLDEKSEGSRAQIEHLLPVLITNPSKDFKVQKTDFVVVLPSPSGRVGTVHKRVDGDHKTTHQQLSASLEVPFGYRSPWRRPFTNSKPVSRVEL